MNEIFKYKYDELFNPTLHALHKLGGSASVTEIEDEVSKILNLTDDEINEIHRGSTTKLGYRLAWARNYLKRYSLLENSSRGVWALTAEGQKIREVEKNIVKKFVANQEKNKKNTEVDLNDESAGDVSELIWQEEVLEILKSMPADKFERLSQRMLRELGFINVEVTGKSGDGGIDGTGVIKIGGVLSFHVVFQCKRYKDTIAPSYIRDFRGAMVGRADKGLFITTGTFTKEAKREAQRDGAPPIDLLDGFQFAEKLKELGLGVEIYKVEKVKIKRVWFANF